MDTSIQGMQFYHFYNRDSLLLADSVRLILDCVKIKDEKTSIYSCLGRLALKT